MTSNATRSHRHLSLLSKEPASVSSEVERRLIREEKFKASENPKLRFPREINAAISSSLKNSAMGTRRLAASMCSRLFSSAATSAPSSSSSAAAAAEIGVQDFVKSIKGVEAHADKVAQAIDGVPTLLQTRSSRLKKLGIPCKQRKMILRYTEKYRQGVWTPKISLKQ